jgi:protein SCO1/2
MMRGLSGTILSTAVVASAGIASLGAVTNGFSAVTSEGARRAEVARRPMAIPEFQAVDQTGRIHGLFADARPGQARAAIVVFIYTRCVDVCSATGSALEQLQKQIQERHLEDRVRLVAVSFDPVHDTPAALARYARQRHADPAVWTIASPLHPEQLPGLLGAFGVVVVATPAGGFEHNAAFQVLDTRGRLARIVGAGSPDRALAQALSLGTPAGAPR